MTEQASDGLSLHAYLRVLARWKRLVIAVVIVVTAAGIAYTWTRTPMYSSTAQLIYVKSIDIANPLSQSFIDRTAQQAEIESVPAVIASSKVAADARELMDESTLQAGYSVDAELTPGVQDAYSNIVSIVGASPDPKAAADAANAYAAAFLAWGRSSARGQVSEAIAVVEGQLAALGQTQRGTSEYQSLLSTLQQLELLEASSTGSFRTITAAVPASAPFEPDKQRGVILSLVAGLVLGIGLAFLLEQFNTRVSGGEQMSELLGLPVMGDVPPVSRKNREKGVLQTVSNPSGPMAEAYRLLRNNLDFVNIDDDIRSIMISSSLQAEGKSVTACNLAVSMALAGKHVILVDADLRSPKVHTYMGLKNAVGLSSVLARKADTRHALVSVALTSSPRQNGATVMTADEVKTGAVRTLKDPSGQDDGGSSASDWLWPDANGDAPILRVLTSGPLPPNPGEVVASHRFGDILEELAGEADLVLVDTPAMLPVGDAAAIAPNVDAMLFIVNAELVKRPALQQARAQIAPLPCRKLGLIEVVAKRRGGYYGYRSAPAQGDASERGRQPAKPVAPVNPRGGPE